jgi:hypothetical protein
MQKLSQASQGPSETVEDFRRRHSHEKRDEPSCDACSWMTAALLLMACKLGFGGALPLPFRICVLLLHKARRQMLQLRLQRRGCRLGWPRQPCMGSVMLGVIDLGKGNASVG